MTYVRITILLMPMLIFIGTIHFVRWFKLESDLKDMSWLVTSEEITHHRQTGVSSMRSIMSIVCILKLSLQLCYLCIFMPKYTSNI